MGEGGASASSSPGTERGVRPQLAAPGPYLEAQPQEASQGLSRRGPTAGRGFSYRPAGGAGIPLVSSVGAAIGGGGVGVSADTPGPGH